MAISKAEGVLFAVGGLAFLGGFLFRKRMSSVAFRNALIFGGGTLLTGGAMTINRRSGQDKLALGDSNLGLALTEVHNANGKTLKVWTDHKMGIKERVHLIQDLVAKSAKDADVRKLALAITGHGRRAVKIAEQTLTVNGAGCPARDDECEAKAIFDWVANPKNVRYTGDIGPHALTPGGRVEAVDLFQSAKRTLEFHGGDCDDHSILTSTLAIENGFPAKLRITSNTGDSWDHIYTMVGTPKLDPTRWIALDTTLGTDNFDKQPRRAKQVDFAA